VPTYQYACTECGKQIEAVQKFTDDPLTTCPACRGRLRKVFNSVGIVFKGSGFYRTDSRNGSSASTPAKSSSDTSSTSSDSNSSSAKTETAASSSSEKSSNTTTSSGSTAKAASA
jgi:putative FmdB family regulatory protein